MSTIPYVETVAQAVQGIVRPAGDLPLPVRRPGQVPVAIVAVGAGPYAEADAQMVGDPPAR